MHSFLISHPKSTNFHESDDSRPSKRLKRKSSLASSCSAYSAEHEESECRDQESCPTSPYHGSPEPEVKVSLRDTKDVDSVDDDEGGDKDDEETTHQEENGPRTDLESILPPVKTDKEAIAEYEASRAAGTIKGLDRNDRLGQRKWIRGKSSIYVDAFNLALDTVLEDESHIFDEKELAVFDAWNSLDYEAQYLYVRLFLRKTAAWHRINRLRYHSDIADVGTAIEALTAVQSLPESTAPDYAHPGELEPPQDCVLGDDFTFADNSSENISSLEEASSLLSLDELKTIAKDAKVQGKNKSELLAAFRRTSRKQSGLEWRGLKRTESEETVASNEPNRDERSVSPHGPNRDALFVKKIMDTVGHCIRLTSATLKLFERVHLVFYRSTEWTEKSLTTIILARISRRNFPEYIVSRSANIFPSRALLLEFEASIRTQFRVDTLLESNPSKDKLRQVLEIFEEVYPRWKVILADEQRKEDREYESGEGAYLRRFSPAWVYTRIVHKGTYVLGRFKRHEREHSVLAELLDQKLFHSARRGGWYQRKALLEEHYMAEIDCPELSGADLEAQKKKWKRIALQTCEAGLQDPQTHLIYHYDLQKRITKLEKNLKIPRREQHDFHHAQLSKPFDRTIKGQQLLSPLQPGQSSLGAKTLWLDPADPDPVRPCSVEALALTYYRYTHAYKGYHSEGGILRTLFSYLFYDILFLYVPNVFQTAYQTSPLDLPTEAFYAARASEINARLAEISNGTACSLISSVHAAHSERKTCVVGLDWTFALPDLLQLVSCFRPDALASVMRVLAQEWRVRGGGVPDLVLWKTAAEEDGVGEVCFVEVKSVNDRLSETQRLWIHVLLAAGVGVEVCRVLDRGAEDGEDGVEGEGQGELIDYQIASKGAPES